MGYLRKPIDPYDRPPKSPHFHRPQGNLHLKRCCMTGVEFFDVNFDLPSLAGVFSNKRSSLPYRLHQKPGMKALLDQMERETPRPKSPHMNNEEPIELAHYPSADR